MSTAFSKVIDAVIAKLKAQPPVCTSIHRARSYIFPEQEVEAISVQWEQAVPQMGTIARAPIDWSTRVSVELYARSLRDSGDVAIDPLLERVFARLAADSTLGGLVSDLQIAGIEAENTADGKKTGWVRLLYVADHRTDNLTLS